MRLGEVCNIQCALPFGNLHFMGPETPGVAGCAPPREQIAPAAPPTTAAADAPAPRSSGEKQKREARAKVSETGSPCSHLRSARFFR